jgi:hypothetical protein
MSILCPKCGNPNSDEIKFCTACGRMLELSPDETGPTPAMSAGPGQVPPRRSSGRFAKILIGVAIAAVLVIVVVLFSPSPGTGMLSSLFPATPSMAPVETGFLATDTPVPEPTPVPTDTPNPTIPVTETIRTSPTPTKTVVCASDRRACGANCTDIMKDADNCGACGVSCTFSQTCQQGTCRARCYYGETSCFDGCHDLQYDAENCGVCGNVCPVGLACNRSVCTPPLATAIPTYSG